MPRGDGTGPLGEGPLTGRRMGYCAGFSVPGFMNPGFGRGFGRGFRYRARFAQRIPVRWSQPQALTKAEEKQLLQEELKALKQEMREIEARLKEIEKKKE